MHWRVLLPAACAVIGLATTATQVTATQPCPNHAEHAKLELQKVERNGEPADEEAYGPFDAEIKANYDGSVTFNAVYGREAHFSQGFEPQDSN